MKTRLIYLLTFIIITACGNKELDNNLAQSELSNQQGWETKKTAKYSISYPIDWSFSEDNVGTEFIVTSPLATKPNDMFAENVNLMVQLVGNMSMKSYMELTNQQLSAMNVSEFNSRDVKDHKELEYLFDYLGNKVKVLQYLWIVNGKAYILTFTDLKSAYTTHIKQAIQILDSFKF